MLDAVRPARSGRPKFNVERSTSRIVLQIVGGRQVDGVEQPAQIAAHALAQAARREHALFARLLPLVGLVVGEPIEQRRLQSLFGRQLGHASSLGQSRPARARRGRALERRALRPHPALADGSFDTRRSETVSPSSW